MNQLSQLRTGRLLLLGLSLGLLWVMVTFLHHASSAHADDGEAGGGGLLGVVSESVPALDGLTEAAASAVHSTSSAIADTVEELPRLGQLPIVEEVVPVVDTALGTELEAAVETVVEPVLAAVVAPVVDMVRAPVEAIVDGAGELVTGPAPDAPDAPEPSDGPVLTPGGDEPTVSWAQRIGTSATGAPGLSAVESDAAPTMATVAEATPDHAPLTPATAPSIPTVSSASSGQGAPATIVASAGWGSGMSAASAPRPTDTAPPGPVQQTDTTPD